MSSRNSFVETSARISCPCCWRRRDEGLGLFQAHNQVEHTTNSVVCFVLFFCFHSVRPLLISVDHVVFTKYYTMVWTDAIKDSIKSWLQTTTVPVKRLVLRTEWKRFNHWHQSKILPLALSALPLSFEGSKKRGHPSPPLERWRWWPPLFDLPKKKKKRRRSKGTNWDWMLRLQELRCSLLQPTARSLLFVPQSIYLD